METKLLIAIERMINDASHEMSEGIHFFIDGWDTGTWKFLRTIAFWVFMATICILTAAWTIWFWLWLPFGINIFQDGTFVTRLLVTVIWILMYSMFGLFGALYMVDNEEDAEKKKPSCDSGPYL